MMKLELLIRNSENLGNLSSDDLLKIREVVEALVSSGGLTGVKGGQTIIHFDGDGHFQGIQLSYFPWRRKKGGIQ